MSAPADPTRSSGPKGSPRFNHIPLTPHRASVLRELATFPGGSGGIQTVMPAATLATLVSMGLAERLPHDRIGGERFIATDAGLKAAATVTPTSTEARSITDHSHRHRPPREARSKGATEMSTRNRAKAAEAPDNPDAARPEPEGLGTITRIPEMQARTLVGDVRDFILQEARDTKNGLPWSQRGEAEQNEMIERADRFARELVRQTVDLIASENYPSFQCLPDGWTVKDGLKITLKASATRDNIDAMSSASENSLFLVFAPTQAFGSARAAVRAVPDQGALELERSTSEEVVFDRTSAGSRQAAEAA